LIDNLRFTPPFLCFLHIFRYRHIQDNSSIKSGEGNKNLQEGKFVVRCSLFVARRSLLVARRSSPVVRCSLFVARRSVAGAEAIILFVDKFERGIRIGGLNEVLEKGTGQKE